ncbi:acyltransferase family protein [Pseudomonas fluorescens]|uniref:Acyltransferase 3 domain-containing protein n=1 Tax=Pseudomonas fluorescens TaxID=294 RepID=A0A5E7N8V8_PSEFL|nr:acyltransferase [Pseudomonas fluorescens]VVP33097.1 hypothetical protein PS880_04443 [Pseudomonas fluorescens]
MEPSGKVEFANTLRGLAAIFVVISHYYGVFWLRRDAAASLTHAPELPLNIFGVPNYISIINSWPSFNFGYFGVALFFLISGFVIPFSLRKGTGLSFLIGRGFRIVPTYMVGFTVTLLGVYFSVSYFSVSWPFTVSQVLVHYIPGLRDLLLSADIDGVVWTLEVEVKFYILCALAAPLFKARSPWVLAIPVALIAVYFSINGLLAGMSNSGSLNPIRYSSIMLPINFIVFMFVGVTLNLMYSCDIRERTGLFMVSFLFIGFCYLLQEGPAKAVLDMAWSYGLALVVFLFAYAFPMFFKSNRVFDFFASISYPLYVVHGVAGYVALRVLLDLGLKAWLSLIIVTACAIIVAWIIHEVIESRSQLIGKKIVGMVFGGSAKSAAA